MRDEGMCDMAQQLTGTADRRRGGDGTGRTGWALALAAALLAGGCGSSGSATKVGPASTATAPPTTTPAPTTTTLAANVPAGFTGFTDVADRFTIATPAGWRQVNPSSPGAAQATQDLVKSNPKLAAALPSGDLVALGIKFLAVEGSGSTLNVVVKPAVGAQDSDLPALATDLKAQYQKLGAVPSATDTIQLSGHSTLRVKVDLKVATPTGGKVTLHEVQYALVANDLLYVLTLAGSSAQLGSVPDTFLVS
jgi:hypothetical protein